MAEESGTYLAEELPEIEILPEGIFGKLNDPLYSRFGDGILLLLHKEISEYNNLVHAINGKPRVNSGVIIFMNQKEELFLCIESIRAIAERVEGWTAGGIIGFEEELERERIRREPDKSKIENLELKLLMYQSIQYEVGQINSGVGGVKATIEFR